MNRTMNDMRRLQYSVRPFSLAASSFPSRWRCAAAILLFAFCGSLAAAAQTQSHFAVDPGQSSVNFQLTGSHEVKGIFHITSGDITFDRATGHMNGKIVVDAGSGDSGEASRDKKMKNDVLKVPSFPTVTFEPTSFSGQIADSGSSQIQVKGTFTIIGQPHEIIVPMTVQLNGNHCTATGSFTVPYVQWGMKDPSVFILRVGKEVKIDLSLTGQITPAS